MKIRERKTKEGKEKEAKKEGKERIYSKIYYVVIVKERELK